MIEICYAHQIIDCEKCKKEKRNKLVKKCEKNLTQDLKKILKLRKAQDDSFRK